jgi:ATP-dependent protease ClpP protease subunit
MPKDHALPRRRAGAQKSILTEAELVKKNGTALLAATVLLAGIGTSDAAILIMDDPGGRIGTYLTRYEGVRSSGERVIIDGYCASACTLVLGAIPHDRICVTPRARLMFHAAYDFGNDGRKITNAGATQSLYAKYPSAIQHWIDQQGGLTPRAILLSGRDLNAMYQPCDNDPRVSAR